MLRYHPLLDFESSPASIQTTAVVPHNPDTFAASQQVPSDNAEEVAHKSHDGKNKLESVLDFARWNNEHKRGTLSLEVFLRQVEAEQDEAVAALEEQSAVRSTCSLLTSNLLIADLAAASSFVQTLIDTKFWNESQARGKLPSDRSRQSLEQSRTEAVLKHSKDQTRHHK